MKKIFKQSKRLTVVFFPLLIISMLNACVLDGKSVLGGNPESTAAASEKPTVTLTVPDNQEIDVVLNQQLTATFSIAMKSSSITSVGTVSLMETISEASVPGVVTYDSVNNIASFDPDNPLTQNTDYTATISIVAESENDVAIENEYVWSFETGTTLDTTPPLLISTSPQDLEIDVSVDRSINATFDEPMNSALIDDTTFTVTCVLPCTSPPSGTVTYAGNTATFVVPNGGYLESDTEYTATIEAEDLAGNPWVASIDSEPNPWTFTTAVHLGPQTVVLAETEPYGVLSNIGVTLGGPGSLLIDGDVGIDPAGACVNCNSVTVSGVIEIGTVPAQDAMVALQAAYDDAVGRTVDQCTLVDSGVLGTNPPLACGGNADGVFPPGLYWSSTSIAIAAGNTITLDGQNDPTSVFIFQSESTIDTIGGNTNINLINGAKTENIFWVAKSSATIGGTNSTFEGTILALVAVTVNTGTTMNGRALARGAEVTVQSGALVTVPGQ